jgi:hypothetical protein
MTQQEHQAPPAVSLINQLEVYAAFVDGRLVDIHGSNAHIKQIRDGLCQLLAQQKLNALASTHD